MVGNSLYWLKRFSFESGQGMSTAPPITEELRYARFFIRMSGLDLISDCGRLEVSEADRANGLIITRLGRVFGSIYVIFSATRKSASSSDIIEALGEGGRFGSGDSGT